MKKVLLTLSAILLMTSCSKESLEGVSVETVSVIAIVNQSPQGVGPDYSSKSVNRGASIYDWVSEINMTFTQNVTGYVKSEDFVLVDDDSGVDNFLIDNIGVGENTITATTKTNSQPLFTTEHLTNGKNNISSKLSEYKVLNPYAKYYTESLTQNILATEPNIVNLNFKTIYGRRITSFRWADDSYYKNNGYANITFIGEENTSNESNIVGDDAVYHYWSDNDSYNGEKVVIKVEVYNSNDVLVKTFTKDIKIKASTSTTCSYLITDDELFSSFAVDVTFQDWIEENCTDGCEDDNDSNSTITWDNNVSLTSDITIGANTNLVSNGGINLNGYTLTIPNGSLKVNGYLNGGGTVNYCTTLEATHTQNSPTLTKICN